MAGVFATRNKWADFGRRMALFNQALILTSEATSSSTMTEVYIAIGALAACLMISYAIFKKGNQKKVEFKKEAPKYVPIARSLTLN